MTITLLYQVTRYIRVKNQRYIKSWDKQNYLVIRGFCYIRLLYNEVPLYTPNFSFELCVNTAPLEWNSDCDTEMCVNTAHPEWNSNCDTEMCVNTARPEWNSDCDTEMCVNTARPDWNSECDTEMCVNTARLE